MPSALQSVSPVVAWRSSSGINTDEETEAELSQASWPQISWHQVLENGCPRKELWELGSCSKDSPRLKEAAVKICHMKGPLAQVSRAQGTGILGSGTNRGCTP